MDYTMIFKGIITILVAIVTMFVIPWIKSKMTEEEFNDILKWVKIAVQAAEMIYKESGMGKAKKAYVESFLEDHGIVYDKKEIEALIESAVLELKKSGEIIYED